MKIVPAIEAEIRRAIRDARAIDPLITITGLEGVLEKKFHRTFSQVYVSRLLHKVGKEALIEIDRTKIEQRLAVSRENYRLVRERMLKILYWTPQSAAPGIKAPLYTEIIEAAKTIVMLDLALLKAERDNGMYKSDIEAAETLHYSPMPQEHRQLVMTAFIRWGMLPQAQVEAIVGPALQLPHGANTTAN